MTSDNNIVEQKTEAAAEPVAVYTNWENALTRNKAGRPAQTIENVLVGLHHAPGLAGILRFNEFANRTEIIGAPWKRYTPFLSDLDLDYIKLAFERAGLTTEKTILSAVNIAAHENSYHPVRDFLNSLSWDGKDYISELFPRFLGAKKCEYTTLITKIMFGGIIGRTMHPGMKFDTCIVLQDTEQGGGKSSMCRLLAGRDEWYATLKTFDDQALVVETITGHLIIELEEMEGLVNAKSIESVRSFLSRATDTYRTPYDKYSRDICRGSICLGTTNDLSFLPMDRAGNRRFLPLKCDKSKAKQHPLDDETETRDFISGAYAQAMHLYRQGELPVVLPAKWQKDLPRIQKDFLPDDTKAGQIEQWIEDNKNQKFICIPMVYQKALNNYDRLPKRYESKEIAAILDSLVDDDGKKILMRHEDSDGIHRFSNPDYNYGRQRAWVRVSEQKNGVSEQFSFPTEQDEKENPFEK